MTLSILVLEEVEKMQLEGLNAVVTGGGRGIGREIALELAEAGASVAVADVNLASAKETVKSIEEMGGSASAICVDISRQRAGKGHGCRCVGGPWVAGYPRE